MTISQPLLLLIVSIFFLPAALGTAIEFSNGQEALYSGLVQVTKVEIIPYPIKYHDNPVFNITAVSSEHLLGRMLDIHFTRLAGADNGISHKKYELCDVTKCPIEPSRPFVITLANVYAVQRSDHLSGEYNVTIYIRRTELVTLSPLDMFAEFKFYASAFVSFGDIGSINGIRVSNVEILPFKVTVKDNPVFRITAVSSKNISSSAMLHTSMYKNRGELNPTYVSYRSYNLCDTTYFCPIESGSRFVFAVPIPYSNMEAGSYRVNVHIWDPLLSMYVYFDFPVTEA